MLQGHQWRLDGGTGEGLSREVLSGTSFRGTGRGKPVGGLVTVQKYKVGAALAKALTQERTRCLGGTQKWAEWGVSGRKWGWRGSASRLWGLGVWWLRSDSEAWGALRYCGDLRAESGGRWEDTCARWGRTVTQWELAGVMRAVGDPPAASVAGNGFCS